MKDIVENRSRLSLSQKVKLMGMAIRENGFLWSCCLGAYYLGSALADKAFGWMDSLRKKHNLPGMNSAAMNKVIWEAWDWSAAGEEWTVSPQWKTAVINKAMVPNMKKGGRILEIGPGGGRWTEELQKIADRLTGVDISEECVKICQERFKDCANVEFMVGDGKSLEGIEDNSVDSLWSFDVFVHINKPEVDAYGAEFVRVMKPGAVGVIHHGSVGGGHGGWRSNLTTEDMNELLEKHGLEVVEQFQSWKEEDEEFEAGLYQDVITVFRSPA